MSESTRKAMTPGGIKTTVRTRLNWLWLTARLQGHRALHPLRRRSVRRRIDALRGARNVLFVCHGNIYRSPYAAACFLAAIARERCELRVGSAGFVGPNRPSPPDAQKLAQEKGLDLSTHRSQLLHGALIAEWDVLVVMSAEQARLLVHHFGVSQGRVLILGDVDPERIPGREIADPWSDAAALLEGSYARVERCTRVLARLAVSSGWGVSAASLEDASFTLSS